MALTKQKTQEVVEKYGTSAKNSGMASVQVALLTERIQYISKHLKTHSKDYASELGLIKMVGQRKRLLSYLGKRDNAEYKKLIKQLDLRK